MTAATVAPLRPVVTIGVDTHSDVHVAVALDQLGRRLDTISIDTTPDGYVSLENWAQELGDVALFGVEGTGSWGAGLVRHLRERGHDSSKPTVPTAAPDAGRARATRSTLKPPHERYSPALRPPRRRPVRGTSK